MNRCEQDNFKLGTFSYLVKIQLFVAFVSLFKYSLLKNWSFRLYNKSTLEISYFYLHIAVLMNLNPIRRHDFIARVSK